MMKWHKTKADKSWQIHATVDAKNSNKGELDGGGGGAYRYSCGRTPNLNCKWCGKVPDRQNVDRVQIQKYPKPCCER